MQIQGSYLELEGNSSPQNTINVVWQWLQTYKCNVKTYTKWSNLFPFVYKLKAVILNVTLMPLMPWLLEKQLE